MEKPIVAIATPQGIGAIGVIRMSGSGVVDIFRKVWISGTHSVDNFVTHRLYLGNIADFSTGEKIDQVLAVLMKGSNSFTGEDIIEISCHGGTEVLRRVLDQLIRAGATPAQPGEFTKRAYLNGKIDLAQAEAVAGLIDSRSALSAKIAMDQLDGRLSKKIGELKSSLKELVAFVEATIDFPEEDTEFIKSGDVLQRIRGIENDLKKLIGSYDHGRVIRGGVKTVIAGPPNAGKSSLLNAMLGSERAIVHHIAGTTRDTIEEEIVLSGIPFRLIDTAGIREAEAEVEEIGMARSLQELKSAEIVLLVLDGSAEFGVDEKFVDELRAVQHLIVVVNKSDVGSAFSDDVVRERFPDRTIFRISARAGDGVDSLISGVIDEMIGKNGIGEREGVIITSRRHFDLLLKAFSSMETAEKTVDESSEFIALHLRTALSKLAEITGEVTTDDILNEIFSKFCIGK